MPGGQSRSDAVEARSGIRAGAIVAGLFLAALVLATALVAVVISIAIAIPLGIASARSDRFPCAQ